MNSNHIETLVLHAGIEPDPTTGAIMTPIFQTSTYVQAAPGDHKGYEYARTQNPTRDVLQKNLAALEGTNHGLCFSTGMGAVDACAKLLSPGDEVVSTNDLYGGTYRLFTKIFAQYGIKFHFVDMSDEAAVRKVMNEKTKMVWVETPTNPLLRIIDIELMIQIGHEFGSIVVVDNTFASPYLQNPAKMGADMDCFLTLRGIKTLHVRMQRHCENGAKVAHWLKSHPKVGEVYWPGFESHPNHAVAKKQMKDFGGMISFTLKDDAIEKALTFLKSTQLFALAESLGGVESLVGHPATMTHASIPKAEREANGLKDSLIRLSVGIEHVDDLIADLEGALAKV